MFSAKLLGQPNKFPIGKGKMCIAPSSILLGKSSAQYYWMFCSFFFFFLIFFPILSAWSSFILWLMATPPDRFFHSKHCGCKWAAAWEICPAPAMWKEMSISFQQHTSLGTRCRKRIPNLLFAAAAQLGGSALSMLLPLILFPPTLY